MTLPLLRINLDEVIRNSSSLVLELGCGMKKTPGRIGIDKLDLPHVDIVADIAKGLPFLPDNSVDEIHSSSFLEHVSDLEGILREIVRVLKPDGKCHIFVPHFSNPYFFSDYTHVRFMGLYTFYYFVDDMYQMKRKVPNFYSDIRIRIINQRLVIASPFKKNYFKKMLEQIFNINKTMQEFYEGNICFLFPCYGLKLTFVPVKKGK